MGTMNYATIKQIAKEQSISVTDLMVLSHNNDPFYIGADAHLTNSQWFADLWQRFGYQNGVHLRRMHYQIVSQKPPVLRPDGQVYENTENNWAYLGNASKWARYLKLVSPEAFVDRRNPEAIINAYYGLNDPTPGYSIWDHWENDSYDYELPELPELPGLPESLPELPEFSVLGYVGIEQAYHVEVWAEKTTMNDVLKPLCQKYRVNLITGAGEMSITAVVEFLKRVEEANRPARILYISDFDPAGLGMPINVARKIEYFYRNESDRYGGMDIRLQPIVLTAEQVAAYDLPRVPVKDSDRRKANFEAAHGEGQVELDALEALYPGELRQIVTKAILQYYDPTLEDRAIEAKYALIDALDYERKELIARYQVELDILRDNYRSLLTDFEGTRQDFVELIKDFQPKVEAHKERLNSVITEAERLNGTLLTEMEAIQVDTSEEDYQLPEPELPEESDNQLYDSFRDYFTQLVAYKLQRNGNN